MYSAFFLFNAGLFIIYATFNSFKARPKRPITMRFLKNDASIILGSGNNGSHNIGVLGIEISWVLYLLPKYHTF